MKMQYEDIPKEQIRSLRKDAFRRNKKIRLWSSLSGGVSVLLASSVSKGVFPQREDAIGRILLLGILAASLGAIFSKAVVDPQVRRAVEREFGQSTKQKK
jgi:hypothetical protein